MSLHCEGNQLTDLAPLASLTQLTWLYCGGNQLTDLTILQSLILSQQLQDLQGYLNPVVEIPQELLGLMQRTMWHRNSGTIGWARRWAPNSIVI